MTMIGGGALLRNIDQLLTQETGVPATLPMRPWRALPSVPAKP
jgi:actin-like ATPase involved in cell morphogenesis